MDADLFMPGWGRRLGCLLYEGLTVVALWMLASAIFTSFYGQVDGESPRRLLQLLSCSIIAAYFMWSWRRGGQTLAMRAWRVRLTGMRNQPLSWPQLLLRWMLALGGTLLLGAGWLWALVDRQSLFLHDRLVGTRVVQK